MPAAPSLLIPPFSSQTTEQGERANVLKQSVFFFFFFFFGAGAAPARPPAAKKAKKKGDFLEREKKEEEREKERGGGKGKEREREKEDPRTFLCARDHGCHQCEYVFCCLSHVCTGKISVLGPALVEPGPCDMLKLFHGRDSRHDAQGPCL
jgi:hypothetical protein